MQLTFRNMRLWLISAFLSCSSWAMAQPANNTLLQEFTRPTNEGLSFHQVLRKNCIECHGEQAVYPAGPSHAHSDASVALAIVLKKFDWNNVEGSLFLRELRSKHFCEEFNFMCERKDAVVHETETAFYDFVARAKSRPNTTSAVLPKNSKNHRSESGNRSHYCLGHGIEYYEKNLRPFLINLSCDSAIEEVDLQHFSKSKLIARVTNNKKTKFYPLLQNWLLEKDNSYQKIVKAFRLSDASFFISDSGKLYGTGFNAFNIFGTQATQISYPIFINFPKDEQIRDIQTMSGAGTLLLTERGRVYGFFSPAAAKVLNLKKETLQKIELPAGVKVTQIVTGFESALLLTSDGEIFGFGSNDIGQIGLPKNEIYRVFSFQKIPLPPGQRAKKLYMNRQTSFAITQSGEIFGTGSNYAEQIQPNPAGAFFGFEKINLPEGEKVKSVSQIGYTTSILTEQGNVYLSGELTLQKYLTAHHGFSEKLSFSDGEKVDQIVGDSNSILALTTSGKIYGFGNNDYGQLGLGETSYATKLQQIPFNYDETVVYIHLGFYQSLIMTSSGNIYGMGLNESKALGLEGPDIIKHPTQIPLPANERVLHIEAFSNNRNYFLMTASGKLFVLDANDPINSGTDRHEYRVGDGLGIKIEKLDP